MKIRKHDVEEVRHWELVPRRSSEGEVELRLILPHGIARIQAGILNCGLRQELYSARYNARFEVKYNWYRCRVRHTYKSNFEAATTEMTS